MRYELTAAAERAVAEAGRWLLDDRHELGLVELLLGLATETETRGGQQLVRAGIDARAILARWPGLRRCDGGEDGAAAEDGEPLETKQGKSGREFSTELLLALRAAVESTGNIERRPELATEHLLSGILSLDTDLSRWLKDQGIAAGADVDAIELEAEKKEEERQKTEEPPPPVEIPRSDPSAFIPRPSSLIPHHTSSPLRLLDAAANRAREGLRTAEDHARFVLDDPLLTSELKQLRHDLVAALARLPQLDLLAARDTLADVGTGLSTAAELSRNDPAAVFTANIKRAQEALRSLEEYSKLLDAGVAAACKQLRYRVYTIERAAATIAQGRTRLTTARLYVLVDGRASEDAFSRLVESLIAAGADVIQLRDKRLADRELLARARRLRALTAGSATLFVMNDRPDLAVLAEADGVHAGQDELSVRDARAIVGPGRLVGVSTHSLEQARAAVFEGADYIGVGPTFPSETKQFTAFTGPELLRSVASEIRLPAFAIGGITLENLPQVLATGITRVAVSGAIVAAADPGNAASAWTRRLPVSG